MKKLRTEVIPNHKSTSGVTIVIFKKSFIPFCWKEIGRVCSIEQLENFARYYALLDGHLVDFTRII